MGSKLAEIPISTTYFCKIPPFPVPLWNLLEGATPEKRTCNGGETIVK